MERGKKGVLGRGGGDGFAHPLTIPSIVGLADRIKFPGGSPSDPPGVSAVPTFHTKYMLN